MKKAYCSECKSEVEVLMACGAVSFFCHTCNELKSSKKILDKEQLKKLETGSDEAGE